VKKSIKATKSAIGDLKPRAEKYEVSVAGHPGLVVRVWPTGRKTFVYRHRQDGQLRRIALEAAILTDAIAEWGRERGDARKGVDVATRRQQTRDEKRLKRVSERRDPSVKDLVERYIAEYAKAHKRSWKADERLLERFALPAWSPMKAKAIRRADVHALCHGVARKTPTQANRLLATVRKLFSFAFDAGLVEVHPCLRMKAPAAENSRDRVLSDAEIKALWNSQALPGVTVEALRLQLLTACRIGEVIGAKPRELDLERALWIVPGERTKNGLDHVIPLTSEALSILEPRSKAKDWLFPWPTAQGCLMADIVSHQIIAARRAMNIEHFTSHDLRRTVTTRLSEFGVSKETRERVLNHKDRSTMSRHYDKYDGLQEKRSALDLWATKLSQIVSRKESTVTPLRRQESRNRGG
jgi:integrase